MAYMISADDAATLINQIADDVRDTGQLPDDGPIDAINLLVNAFVSALNNKGVALPLATVVTDNYGEATLDDVIGWMHS